MTAAECPACRATDPRPDGSCRRCALRAAVAPLLALLPEGTLAERAASAEDAAREALVAQALAVTYGHRERAAEALHVRRATVSEALARYPWLAAQWPTHRQGRPPPGAVPCPTCRYAPCHPSCPGPAYAIPPDEA